MLIHHQKILHITVSVLVMLFSTPLFLELYAKKTDIHKIIIIILLLLLFYNSMLLLVNYLGNKVIKWYEKKRRKNYSLFEWLGESNIHLDLYSDLSEMKDFKPEKFYENHEIIKCKIKIRFRTLNDLKGLKLFLETRTESPKYTAIMSSTQTIIIAAIIPIVITIMNLNEINQKASFSQLIVFLILWFGLLKTIDFFGKENDKMKVLLKLVKECIQELESDSADETFEEHN